MWFTSHFYSNYWHRSKSVLLCLCPCYLVLLRICVSVYVFFVCDTKTPFRHWTFFMFSVSLWKKSFNTSGISDMSLCIELNEKSIAEKKENYPNARERGNAEIRVETQLFVECLCSLALDGQTVGSVQFQCGHSIHFKAHRKQHIAKIHQLKSQARHLQTKKKKTLSDCLAWNSINRHFCSCLMIAWKFTSNLAVYFMLHCNIYNGSWIIQFVCNIILWVQLTNSPKMFNHS